MNVTGGKVAVVAIGRNEGDRLAQCLGSVMAIGTPAVYVDSGSTDSSVALARGAGIDVVELDGRIPFTAARARNEGFEHLRQLAPDLSYIQFVDGDCEIVAGWIEKAVAFLDSHRDVAVVCGRLRERYPERSIYNRVCDIEWDRPVGETHACGGNALMRVDAFERAGRYRADLTSGEEPELCKRLRATGWRVWRLDAEMALHDAAMMRFGQWWWRAVRTGYGFAQHAYLFRTPSQRWGCLRAWLWGVWLPLACLAFGVVLGPWGWASWLIYPLRWLRQTLRTPGPLSRRSLSALFQLVSAFPESWGQVKFMHERFLGRQARLIEYK
ncbi:glycosyltransferase family A protein [Bradyrhizobium sp. CB82]|uniref:glycosyltransferase n=1 Tax=Bradyrhizobium sp. CB82 TaxID=3039159 RepID=UPI0024B141D8|nr:glycosyltransferase family A protein [Bradyrhizobium sp. CB82]WFU38834.1 glycosyltransferase family A protein [Bradyrhizobium sp. CB82]